MSQCKTSVKDEPCDIGPQGHMAWLCGWKFSIRYPHWNNDTWPCIFLECALVLMTHNFMCEKTFVCVCACAQAVRKEVVILIVEF